MICLDVIKSLTYNKFDMNLQSAFHKKGLYMHLLGIKQSDGTTFTDILIAPVNYIKPYYFRVP